MQAGHFGYWMVDFGIESTLRAPHIPSLQRLRTGHHETRSLGQQTSFNIMDMKNRTHDGYDAVGVSRDSTRNIYGHVAEAEMSRAPCAAPARSAYAKLPNPYHATSSHSNNTYIRRPAFSATHDS